jgi:hypothetical protein
VYLATLTCWAGCGGTKEIVWNAKAEVKEFVEHGLKEGYEKRNPAGAIAVVAKYLSTIRGALVQEGVKVLKGLIAGRLLKEDGALV